MRAAQAGVRAGASPWRPVYVAGLALLRGTTAQDRAALEAMTLPAAALTDPVLAHTEVSALRPATPAAEPVREVLPVDRAPAAAPVRTQKRDGPAR